MSDFEEKLNSILSNPDAMAQVINLAQSLGGSMGATASPPPEPPVKSAGNEARAKPGDLFSGIDPALMTKLLPLLGELNQTGSDERLQLLYALRPFLKPERQDKVERAVKAARLIHIGKKFLMTMGESNV